MPSFSVILAAAGKSSRFNDPNFKKPFANLKNKPVWLYSAELFQKVAGVKQVIMVISPEDKDEFIGRFGANVAVMGIDVVLGGAERADSVEKGLAKVDPSCDYVVIHDAARPCIDQELIVSVMDAAIEFEAAVPAIPINSTLKRSAAGKMIDETVDRSNLYQAQTPQVFKRGLIQELYASRNGAQPTDEAQLLEMNGHPVAMVAGSPFNIKITKREDLRFARACLDSMPATKFDAPIHPFANDDLFR
ncbi:MAG: 2-C-methyl-D-erythritol 4-phosphate cytidylyltransferase [Mariniblastus sp.]|nr:2-C-methyl-D-erythritol 4-phosphate cytidylyltransferase [Mariniblastus sp.]